MHIANRGPPLGEDDLAILQESLGFPLLEEYRSFLREYNGGSPVPNVVEVEGAPGTPTDIQVFF
jgi:hypothetical protein